MIGWAALAPASLCAEAPPLRIGLTPVFLDDQVSFLVQWRVWLEKRLGRNVQFVQRGSYREIVDLLRGERLDFAWLCGYPFVRFRRDLKLVAVPSWRGQPLYQSYLIVPADDRTTRSILELRGKVFAFSDPDSNSGYLYPNYLLHRQGENPVLFFSRSFFTWAHRKVVEAVGVGLADGGSVDGYVWETLAQTYPDLTRATRVVSRSGDLGFPPFVARRNVPQSDFRAFRAALLDMSSDPAGRELLAYLRLDGMVQGDEALFEEIARMAKTLAK
ncbi:MAG: PhnD/SsuA/transferrin family substrate-binding protein [Betaproteobacteria bacterium]|nr:MAG: PhnD/SsuA/transferrin family substrate-binding protein [Betaproteobacteria bacterium]